MDCCHTSNTTNWAGPLLPPNAESIRKIRVHSFARSESELAAYQYSLIEKENIGRQDIQSVLVSVDSLDALRLAYPNYYLDTSGFVELIKRCIEEYVSLEWGGVMRMRHNGIAKRSTEYIVGAKKWDRFRAHCATFSRYRIRRFHLGLRNTANRWRGIRIGASPLVRAAQDHLLLCSE